MSNALTYAATNTAKVVGVVAAIVGMAAVIVVPVAAWFTHIILCFQTGNWGFLVAGALFFPVAVVHGVGHWFGAW